MYRAVAGGGAAYGAFWGLMPSVASELFGLSSFATIYCALGFATSVASWSMATQIAGALTYFYFPPCFFVLFRCS